MFIQLFISVATSHYILYSIRPECRYRLIKKNVQVPAGSIREKNKNTLQLYNKRYGQDTTIFLDLRFELTKENGILYIRRNAGASIIHSQVPWWKEIYSVQLREYNT